MREWVSYIEADCPFPINKETLLIGHSSGAVAVLVLAQLLEGGVGQVLSVGSFKDLDYLHSELNFHANDRFFDIDFDFEAIRKNVEKIAFIHSDNDPYCPLDHAEYLAENTGGKLVVISGQGHFNTEYSADYKQFPKLLEVITG